MKHILEMWGNFISMNPILFEVLGWVAGIFFVLTIVLSVALIFVLVAKNRQDEHAEDTKYINEREIERK